MANQDEGLLSNVPGKRHDPFSLAFDKQFQEVDEEYESVRTIQKTCYQSTKKGCFNFWSLVFGIILSFVWGIVMGTLQFALIWIIYPWVKVWKLYWIPAVSVAGDLLNALCGKTLSNLASKGTVVNVNGNEVDMEKMKRRDEKSVALAVGNGTAGHYHQV
eukprot:CAMPEP_0197048092 /NCGR_PEP_ID=MMETSP1384-20130603/23491_1 /TAXON_ID=29189 /ORGANISM="Ammonia sp." /LENGTH=159 /DNA_ID=CAMNT_0042480147 /DNA_START=23 /DNA_END=502 /DNA_ORIENTATION=-